MVISPPPPQQLDLRAPASDLAVRDLLARVRTWLRAHALPDDTCSTVEIVLAEALNNVVEHAYPPELSGAIRLALQRGSAHLVCVLSDHGTALPGGILPDGTLPARDVARDALPEGGFGWFLIRDLSDSLDYRRAGRWNHLTLEFHLDPL
jgi:serine/threonine-protein kinase RsbW